jgi:hypothetical protein
MPNAPSADPLVALLSARVTPEVAGSFADELKALRDDARGARLLTSFTAAARRLGRAALGAEPSASLQGPDDAVPLAPFTADVAGRVLLLLTFAAANPSELEPSVWEAYREGDTSEKIAVVRALALLPDNQRFLSLALDAGRTNDTHLFRALACDNPFPARHYPELEFNKLVMKAAFVRVPVERVLGLARRGNAELSRMVLDYVAEQEAAGRSFPAPIWLAACASPPPGAITKMLEYVGHADAEMRLWAVRALALLRAEGLAPLLTERLLVERDDAVKSALRAELELLTSSEDRSRSR